MFCLFLPENLAELARQRKYKAIDAVLNAVDDLTRSVTSRWPGSGPEEHYFEFECFEPMLAFLRRNEMVEGIVITLETTEDEISSGQIDQLAEIGYLQQDQRTWCRSESGEKLVAERLRITLTNRATSLLLEIARPVEYELVDAIRRKVVYDVVDYYVGYLWLETGVSIDQIEEPELKTQLYQRFEDLMTDAVGSEFW